MLDLLAYRNTAVRYFSMFMSFMKQEHFLNEVHMPNAF